MSASWHDVGALSELKFEPGAAVKVDGRWLAVFPLADRDGGGYSAIDNACPHAGAPLCDGSYENGTVTCFLHLWGFDVRTGACSVGPDWNVAVYPVRVVDGRVEIELPGRG